MSEEDFKKIASTIEGLKPEHFGELREFKFSIVNSKTKKHENLANIESMEYSSENNQISTMKKKYFSNDSFEELIQEIKDFFGIKSRKDSDSTDSPNSMPTMTREEMRQWQKKIDDLSNKKDN